MKYIIIIFLLIRVGYAQDSYKESGSLIACHQSAYGQPYYYKEWIHFIDERDAYKWVYFFFEGKYESRYDWDTAGSKTWNAHVRQFQKAYRADNMRYNIIDSLRVAIGMTYNGVGRIGYPNYEYYPEKSAPTYKLIGFFPFHSNPFGECPAGYHVERLGNAWGYEKNLK